MFKASVADALMLLYWTMALANVAIGLAEPIESDKFFRNVMLAYRTELALNFRQDRYSGRNGFPV